MHACTQRNAGGLEKYNQRHKKGGSRDEAIYTCQTTRLRWIKTAMDRPDGTRRFFETLKNGGRSRNAFGRNTSIMS